MSFCMFSNDEKFLQKAAIVTAIQFPLYVFFRSIKVDCITVSTSPVKTTIDDLIQQLFDALLNSLRRNIINHKQTVENFVTEGMEALSTRPQTVEEIGLANAKHEELSKRIPEVRLSLVSLKLTHASNGPKLFTVQFSTDPSWISWGEIYWAGVLIVKL